MTEESPFSHSGESPCIHISVSNIADMGPHNSSWYQSIFSLWHFYLFYHIILFMKLSLLLGYKIDYVCPLFSPFSDILSSFSSESFEKSFSLFIFTFEFEDVNNWFYVCFQQKSQIKNTLPNRRRVRIFCNSCGKMTENLENACLSIA